MKRSVFTILLVAIVCGWSFPGRAQTFDASHLGTPAVDVTGSWRLHYGDSPQWAARDFDDSSWQLQPADKRSTIDHKYIGYLWYRMRMKLPPHHGPLSISIDGCTTSYEVFANGQLIGHFGGMPPHESRFEVPLVAYSLPLAPEVDSVEIAIRVWSHTIVTPPGLSRNSVRIGDVSAIANEVRNAQRYTDEGSVQNWVVIAAFTLLAVVVLALFAFQPDRSEYLWFAAWQLTGSIAGVISTLNGMYRLPYLTQFDLGVPLQFLSMALLLEFYYAFVQERPGRWLRMLQCALVLTAPIGPSILYGQPSARGYGYLVIVPEIEIILLMVVIGWMLVVRARRGNREAGLLLIPTILFNLSTVLNLAVEAGAALGLLKNQDHVIPDTHFGDFVFSADTWTSLLFFLAILILLFYRFLNVSRQQTRSAAEIEAARQVQHVLLPEQLISIPGVTIESEYHPADVVGGDFFQVIPANDGSLLVVVGDVAGKGMGAAMLVGVIVGTIRTAVQFDTNPAFVLATLNDRLCGRADGGFVTCLAARLTPDGEFTLANAGHLAPYRNGEELQTIPELPLGVSEGTVYEKSSFSIAPGDRLTFVSDGVVEATRPGGELFGFERTREISRGAASAIAQAAKTFGQTDDITVVTLTRTMELVPAS